ncbi:MULTISPECIES: hypothetical protein [Vibrio]|uniref:hypothetical protein n=1 Tax=Vibrio TaxID=662 RepID=UPI000B53AD92|nr:MULTISPECIES: hypothetical protein [Vibrio]ASG01617.1 hypothetical protein CEG15_15770 [Vibrio anguillarum]MBD1567519.1 hypothetical protein [Vibrio sp. S12_S33]
MEIFLVFLALMVACITLFIQRQHNRKELLPILHTYFSASTQDNSVVYEFKLINDGNGAAILKKVELLLADGETIEITSFNSFFEVIQQKNPHSKDIETSLPFCLSANSSEVIYRYALYNTVTNKLDGSSVRVTAESVYGDTVIAHNTGFDVISNRRDHIFEVLFGKVSDSLVSLWEKLTNNQFK